MCACSSVSLASNYTQCQEEKKWLVQNMPIAWLQSMLQISWICVPNWDLAFGKGTYGNFEVNALVNSGWIMSSHGW